jgi:16S rRNA (cytidine1402-2'-O)-methyltransferase
MSPRHYAETDTPKGEIVICVGPPKEQPADAADVDRLLLSLAQKCPPQGREGCPDDRRPEARYRRLLELRGQDG